MVIEQTFKMQEQIRREKNLTIDATNEQLKKSLKKN